MEDDTEQEKVFNNAAGYVRSAAGSLKAEDLLYLYARYKQAIDGSCNTSRPGIFDFQGKQKWDAWKKLEGMTQQEAMCQYIEHLSHIQPDWELQISSGEVKSRSGMGVGVSTLGGSDSETLEDKDKTVYDWCKEGNIARVVDILSQTFLQDESSTTVINCLDDEGLALLHWAVDRGLDEMVGKLLDLGADVCVRDTEGLTPLHYAVTCEHQSIIKLLLSRGADTSLTDDSGQRPVDSTDNIDIISLLTASTAIDYSSTTTNATNAIDATAVDLASVQL